MLHTLRTALPFALAIGLLPLAAAVAAEKDTAHGSLLPGDQLYYRGLFLEQNGRIREAIASLERAAQSGGAKMDVTEPSMDSIQRKALVELGKLYLAAHNTKRGLEVLVKAALLGDNGAAGQLAKLQLDQGIVPPDLKSLIPIYMAQARASSNTMALLLGQLASQGKLGGSRNSANDWYAIAARRGSDRAIEYLVFSAVASGHDATALTWIKRLKKDAGSVYLSVAKDFLEDGDRLKRNIPAAVGWYRRALAVAPDAAVRAASRFMELAGEADKAAILAAVRTVADRGDADAAFLVAKTLDRGNPTELDPDAIRYYAIAAKGGRPEAVTGLMRVSAFVKPGEPPAKDLLDGITAAANKGNTDAMLALANLYAVGTLLSQNVGQSFSWYLKAAKAGNPEAEFRAGMAYAQGLGTDTDMGQARHWLTAANDHGYALAGPSLQSLEAKK
jgi:TPR repeat protein